MANDLVGLAMIAVLAGGAYILLTSDWAKQNLNGPDPNADPGNLDDPGNTTGGTGSSTCKSLCKAADCSGYDDEGCTAGCSVCKGSPGTTSGSGSFTVNCNDGHTCNERCTNGWCTSMRKCCKNSSCKRCNMTGGGGTQSFCPSHSHQSGTNCLCDSGYKSSGGQCVPSGTSSGGGSTCKVENCPSCGAYPNYRVCKNNKCGCDKVGSSTPTGGGGSSDPCKGLTGATYTACRKAHGLLAKVSYHARPNLRTSYRLSLG